MLCWVSCASENSVPPVARAPASSNTDRSKENGAWSTHTSAGAAPSTPHGASPPRRDSSTSHAQKLSKHAAVTSTPLGSPVDPDVNRI